jgi:ligand-binding sensor domain-containing protein
MKYCFNPLLVLKWAIFCLLQLLEQDKPRAQGAVREHQIPSYVWAEHISYSEGFNLNQIRDFCADRQGMVWVAGQQALARFSGVAFQYYFPADSIHRNGLGKGAFFSLDTDETGRVWTSNSSGVYWFDEIRDSFCLLEAPFGKGWSEAERYLSFDAQKQNLWLADEKGLFWFEMANKTWHSTSIEKLEPNGLMVSQQGKLLVSQESGSLLFDPAQNKALKMYVPAKSVFETVDGAIWLGTWRGGLRRINPVTLEEECFFPPGDYKPNVYGEAIVGLGTAPALTGNHLLWCGTQINGVFYFDIQKKEFVGNLNWDERGSTGLPGYFAGAMFSDPSGVLWMDQLGLVRITPFRQQLLAQKVLGLQAKDSKELTIRKILPDKYRPNYQWFAVAYYGLVSYNTEKKEIEKWWFYPKNTPVLLRERNYRSTISYDQKGRLWASSEKGFLIVDKNQKTREVFIKTYNNENTAVNNFVFDENNRCWMATNLGLCAYNIERQEVEKIENPASEAANRVQDLEIVKDGLWLATENGLHFYHFGKKTFSTYAFEQAEANAKTQNKFYGLCCTQTGHVYATNDQGLVTLEQGQLKQLCNIPNAHTTHSQSIEVDQDGNIWVIAFAILRKIDPKTGQILATYNTGGGFFQNIEAGKIHISLPNSIIHFDPLSLSPLLNTHKPVLINFKVYDQRQPVNFEAAALQPLQLNWRQNAVTFDFDCPDFSSYTETTYETILEGYDKEWKPQGKKRSITFTNLAPGDYVFRVRATNLMGIKHPENAVFQFKIAAPFWQTWWFRLLSFVFVCSGIYLAFRARVQAVKREETRKTTFYKLKAETEMRALRAQMNPHFIFNCMNTIEAFIIEKREKEASSFLQKFSKLIRAVLENSQHDAISLALEIEVLEWYIQLEQIRANHRWNYSINIAANIDREKTQLPPLILQPFVENAILHGLYHRTQAGGNLQISIASTEAGILTACIADNGIGRALAAGKNKHLLHKKRSLGAQFTIERVRKLNALGELRYDVNTSDLEPNQENMTGTLVKITLPC